MGKYLRAISVDTTSWVKLEDDGSYLAGLIGWMGSGVLERMPGRCYTKHAGAFKLNLVDSRSSDVFDKKEVVLCGPPNRYFGIGTASAVRVIDPQRIVQLPDAEVHRYLIDLIREACCAILDCLGVERDVFESGVDAFIEDDYWRQIEKVKGRRRGETVFIENKNTLNRQLFRLKVVAKSGDVQIYPLLNVQRQKFDGSLPIESLAFFNSGGWLDEHRYEFSFGKTNYRPEKA